MPRARRDSRDLFSTICNFGPLGNEPSDTLYRSLVDCLPPAEVCRLLDLDMVQERYIRHIYLRKIVLDMRTAILPCHDALVMEIVRRFPHFSYHQAQRAGDTLGAIFDVSSEDLKHAIARLFLASPYRGLRKYAYRKFYDNPYTLHEMNSGGQWKGPGDRIHLDNWHASFAQPIEALWEKYKDAECAEVIIAQFPQEFLICHFNNLQRSVVWHSRRHLYERTFEAHEELIQVAINHDPITAVWVLAKLGMKLDEDIAYSLYCQVRHWEKSGLLLRSYGSMGLWRVIMRIHADLQHN